ncbi:MAG TPA: flagellin [Pirellulales bacterium]|nr:flagellin [Pirellulales bacterium]
MTRINTNIVSLQAQSNLYNNQIAEQTALQRLSTGLRINSGKDDPSGLIASSVLGSEVTSIGQAITNSQRANNIVATADAALSQVSTLLNNVRGLVQASANKGAISAAEIAANQVQVDSAIDSIDRIGQTTVFGGDQLLNGNKAFNISGSLGSVFQSTADIQVTSFTQGTNGNNSNVISLNQQATQASTQLVGLSQSAGAGLNNLSLGTSTHASTTIQGFGAGGANAAGAAAGSELNGLSLTTGAGATAVINASAITGALAAGTTTTLTLTNQDSAITALNNTSNATTTTITLDNGINGGVNGLTADAAGAGYLAAQINGVSKQTGLYATVAGANVTLHTLQKNATADIIVASDNASLASGGAATAATVAGTAVGAGVDLTTLQIAGSKNSSSPVNVTFDNASAVNDSQAIVDAINARTSSTGLVATLGTDGIAGTSLGASVILTDSKVGSGSYLLANALANGATGSNTTTTGDATLLNGAETNQAALTGAAGVSGTSNTTTYQITGDKGNAIITVNNDAVLNDTSALANAINAVKDQTGVTATGSGAGSSLVLKSQNYGSNAKLSFQAIAATNSSDITLINSTGTTGTQEATAGLDAQGTVTTAQGGGQFTGDGSSISYTDSSISFNASITPSLAAPTSTTNTITGSVLAGFSKAGGAAGAVDISAFKITGNLGTVEVKVNTNDLIGNSQVLTDAINNVSAQTGVTASGAGAGADVTLTAANAGSTGIAQLSYVTADSTTDNSATFNAAGTSTLVTGKNVGANATSTFNVTGGALFQIGASVNSQNQVTVSIAALDAHLLGRNSSTTGNASLYDLRTGGSQVLSNADLTDAATLVDQAISQIATLRGQLGALQSNVLESNISSQQTALEQVTTAQSSIQDTDFAKETAALTRAQVLVQAGTSVLSIANSAPQQLLALLPRG